MRILQLIDTLDAGGAERMAVNYANSLNQKFGFSAIVVTRKEGNLKQELSKNVAYYFLNKKSTLQLTPVLHLKKIIKTNKIEIIHAHGTSFFTAFLVKLIYPKIKIIWHDHYGDSEFLESRPKFILKFVSYFFSGIIAVNEQLVCWATKELPCAKIMYLPNFTVPQSNSKKDTFLKGKENHRIVCLANFRAQKNHLFLLTIATKIKTEFPDWSFHLIGKNFNDAYYASLQNTIAECQLENHVFMYDSVNDIEHVLSQSNIGVLTSKSEGLPLVLLEYGWAKLPVVVTNVGEIGKIIKDNHNGFIVKAEDELGFYIKLKMLILDATLQKKMGQNLNSCIKESYSEAAVLHKYLNFIKLCF